MPQTPSASHPYLSAAAFDSAVALLIVEAGERRNAMTISFFSEVAHHPTSLWISVANDSYTHELLEQSGQFTLSVLQERQAALALHCGNGSGRGQDRCAGLPLYRGRDGGLYVEQALACCSCKVSHSEPLETHTLYLANIHSGERSSGSLGRRHLLCSDLMAEGRP